MHKQSRVKNQFEESDPIIDEKWANWVPDSKIGNGWDNPEPECKYDSRGTIFYYIINDYDRSDGIPFDFELNL